MQRHARSSTTSPPSRSGGKPIHPQYVARLIDQLADPDAVFVPDVGSPVIYAARYLRKHGGRRLIGSFVHGRAAEMMNMVRAGHGPGAGTFQISVNASPNELA